MAITGNLINIGQGVFVSEASFQKMKKEALNETVKQLVKDTFSGLGLDDEIREMVRSSVNEVAETAKKQIRQSANDKIRSISTRDISATINHAVKDAVLSELASAGLAREANALVWSAINNMKKAALQ